MMFSSPYLRKRIDESDCIISIGVKLTDTITGGFTQDFMKEQVIEIHPYTVKIIDRKYGPVVMSQGDQPELLAKLGERFGKQNS